LLLIFW